MLAMYSRWMGETLRSTAKLRSSGAPVSGRSVGMMRAGLERASAILKRVELEDSRLLQIGRWIVERSN